MLAVSFYELVFNTLKLANLPLDEDIEDCLGLVFRSNHVMSILQLNYRVSYNQDDSKGGQKGNEGKKKRKNARSKFTTLTYTLHTILLI